MRLFPCHAHVHMLANEPTGQVRGIPPLKGARAARTDVPSLGVSGCVSFPGNFCGPDPKRTNTHSPKVNVCECNRVLAQSLLWVSVVCCASEMKAGLSNNSEFNTGATPLMRTPRALGSYPRHRGEKRRQRRETYLKSPICVTSEASGGARPVLFTPINNDLELRWRSL